MSRTQTPVWQRMVEDPRAYFFKFARMVQLRVLQTCSAIRVFPQLWMKGITTGKACSFYGVARFHRVPGASIHIGSHCVFRSDRSSNLIGNNRPTVISALGRGACIQIGSHTGLTGVAMSAMAGITLGNYVLIGANTTITDNDWHPDRFQSAPEPVRIEDRVWVGMNCIILKGVTIGANSVIGAGSVVTGNIPSNVIAAGNPCKVLKHIE